MSTKKENKVTVTTSPIVKRARVIRNSRNFLSNLAELGNIKLDLMIEEAKTELSLGIDELDLYYAEKRDEILNRASSYAEGDEAPSAALERIHNERIAAINRQ